MVNSCKKDNSDTVSYFLTSGKWTLADVTRETYVGDTLKRTDTLNLTCHNPQIFTFTTDNVCTLTGYHCIDQSSTGKWQINTDNLTLQTTLTVKDTSKRGIIDTTAFSLAKIDNLGRYSLVLKAGYISTYYTSKTPRVITRYGFVHSSN